MSESKGIPESPSSSSRRHREGAKSWLQIFRINLLPVFLLPLFAGYLAGGGNLFSFYGVFLFAWGVLAFAFSFGHNSLEDALSGHDLEAKDPETHPLVSGEVSLELGRKVIHLGLCLVAVLGVCLAAFGAGSSFLASSFLLVFSVLGYVYNGVSKFARWSFLPISASFSSLVLFGYSLAAGHLSTLVLLLALFVFLTMWFEADFEGVLKDIRTEESLLGDLGSRITGNRIEWRGARAYGWALKLTGLGVITYAVLWEVLTPLTALAWGFFCPLAIVVTAMLTAMGSWNRGRVMFLIGIEELSCFSLGVAATAPIAGWAPVIFLIVFSVLWVPVASSGVYGASTSSLFSFTTGFGGALSDDRD